jgi:hypothetical protein
MHILIYHLYSQCAQINSVSVYSCPLTELQMHPPTAYPQPAQIYAPFTDMHNVVDHSVSTHPGLARTPSSSGGGSTPAKANGWIPVKADAQVEKTRIGLS